jgi:hypothetical protein
MCFCCARARQCLCFARGAGKAYGTTELNGRTVGSADSSENGSGIAASVAVIAKNPHPTTRAKVDPTATMIHISICSVSAMDWTDLTPAAFPSGQEQNQGWTEPGFLEQP